MQCYKCDKQIIDDKYSFNRIGDRQLIICYHCCGQQAKANLLRNNGGMLRLISYKSGKKCIADMSGTLRFEVDTIEELANATVYWFKLNGSWWSAARYGTDKYVICKRHCT